jgi:predicted kinase
MKSRALLVRGHQGVGKSTLSEKIATDYGFCRLSKDDLYVPILEAIGDHKTASKLAYLAIQSTLRANANSGIDFVVDAPFNGALGEPELMSDLEERGFAAKSVLLICKDRTDWSRRLEARGDPSTPNHLVTSLAEIESYRGTLEAEPFENELVLDTSPSSLSLDELARRCVEYTRAD